MSRKLVLHLLAFSVFFCLK